MKIIFLDFDGVIVTAHTRYHSGDPYCVHLLNRVIKKTEAKIVVSSSWRVGCTVEELQTELKGWGVDGEVIDKTPHIHRVIRGLEIDQWLREHPDVKSYVILDDDADMLPNQLLVKTSSTHGMDYVDAEKAIQILGATDESSTSLAASQKA